MRLAGAIIFCGILMWSCSKVSDDSVPPQILLYTSNAEVVMPGDVIEVTVQAADNEELAQARLRILSSFTKSFGAWKVVNISDISGATFQTTYFLSVPDSALAGMYSMGFQVADERGNASIDSLLYFTILQPGIGPEFIDFATTPFLSVAGPNTLSANDSLIFTGFAAGDSLTSVDFEFKSATDANIETYPHEIEDASLWSFTENADTVRFADFQTLPVRMVVRIKDKAGHQARLNFPLFFSN